MSSQSNILGRAYEYICLITLKLELSKICKVTIDENNNYKIGLDSWNTIDKDTANLFRKSSQAMIGKLIELEPMILEEKSKELLLRIQPDTEGIDGDVRDILLIRDDVKWEIGLSIKHNHFAVKHSRLGSNLDFAEKWFGTKCSNKYWNEIAPIFEYTSNEKEKNTKWNEMKDKFERVYIPLLKAFINEVNYQYNMDKEVPKKLVEYLLGKYDFYKIISVDAEKLTRIQPYNFHKKLNKASSKEKPKLLIPESSFPTRIVKIEMKPESNNTAEIYLNEGWQFSLRIHNASTYVESSLKFDVQLVGMPTSIIALDCEWK